MYRILRNGEELETAIKGLPLAKRIAREYYRWYRGTITILTDE